MSMLEDCSNYLDGTIYNLQQKLISFEDQDQDIHEMLQAADNEYGYGGLGGNSEYGLKGSGNKIENDVSSNNSALSDSKKLGVS